MYSSKTVHMLISGKLKIITGQSKPWNVSYEKQWGSHILKVRKEINGFRTVVSKIFLVR